MTNLPDDQMDSLLRQARRISSDVGGERSVSPGSNMLHRNDTAGSLGGGVLPHPRRQSTQQELMGDNLARRLSEAGVNRRPSAAQILTEDTDSFIVGVRVYVDGVKPGRIQYIGETKFGPGDWAGVVLDEPIGKNDGSVGKTRYFQCEPYHGVFSRLFRLTREPIEGAEEVLAQVRKYGYEIVDAPVGMRRGSVGSGGGSRRGSTSERRGSVERSSISPRAVTPEMRRSSVNRNSPDPMVRRGSAAVEPRRTSLSVPERRGSMGQSPLGRRTPGRSPLASPRASRSYITGGEVRIEKDPEMTKLAQEARRLSMEGGSSSRRPSGSIDQLGNRTLSTRPISTTNKNGNGTRRPSEGFGTGTRSPRLGNRWSSENTNGYNANYRRSSESPVNNNYRRPSEGISNLRRGSNSTVQKEEAGRRSSTDVDAHEVERRRLSEAGLRRPSVSDRVLNEDTSNLMVGQQVWVDGDKHGRIAFIGGVHFASGEVAGVHLEKPLGKNNGSVGGTLYFQCEPKHGIFARLHRLSREPLFDENEEYIEE